MTIQSVISLENKIKEVPGPWSPIELAKFNDQVVRMALFQGEYPWHKHTNEDELFLVVKGSIVIRIKEQPDLFLKEGQMAVVPKGVEHSPKSSVASYVLMFEPYTLQSKGD